MIQYNVITWNINTDSIEHYDIMPYLYRSIEKEMKDARIKKADLDYEWLKQQIDLESRYQFWARCEYEVIVSAWPTRKNGFTHKLDVYEQIKMNLDNIAKLMYDDFQKGKSARSIKDRKSVETRIT